MTLRHDIPAKRCWTAAGSVRLSAPRVSICPPSLRSARLLVCPSVHWFICSSMHRSVRLPTNLSVRLCICLSVCLSASVYNQLICPFVHLPIFVSFRLAASSLYPSACPSVHLSVCPSVHPSVCPSVCLSVCLSVCPVDDSYLARGAGAAVLGPPPDSPEAPPLHGAPATPGHHSTCRQGCSRAARRSRALCTAGKGSAGDPLIGLYEASLKASM